MKHLAGSMLLLFGLLLGFDLLRPVLVSAITENEAKNPTLTWVNKATISVTLGSTIVEFFDPDISDTTYEYVKRNYPCDGTIRLVTEGGGRGVVGTPVPSKGRIDVDYIPSNTTTNTGCDDLGGAVEKPIGNVPAWNVSYIRDGNKITRVDNEGDSYTQSSASQDVFTKDGGDDTCNDLAYTGAGSNKVVLYNLTGQRIVRGSGDREPAPDYLKAPGCYVESSREEGLGSVSENTAPPGGFTDDTEDEGSGVGDRPECLSSGFDLSWIVCPLVIGMANAADGIFNSFVLPFLRTDTRGYTDPNDGIFKAWSNFRILANILLILFLFVAVFGQSIGGGLVDAYTAKKVLPRLAMAVILINISIYIGVFLVDVVNVVGNGIAQLIYAPFSGDANLFSIRTNGALDGALVAGGIGLLVTSIFATGAVAGLVAAAIPMILLFILLPALLAFLGVMITLILRKGLIIFLLISSPIAFALYCLPNTEKYAKQWWDLFSKALLVYPIVMIVFAMADVLASILSNRSTSGAEDVVSDMVAIVLLVLPLFLIPFAFKLAGGALTSVYGAIQGRNKQGAEFIKGNPNDPRSLRNQARYKMGSQWLSTRGRAYDALKPQSMSDKSRFRRGVAVGLSKVVGAGNIEAKRAIMNEERQKLAAAQYSQGDDANMRAFWARKHTGADREIRDADGNVIQTMKSGGWYSPYQETDGTYKEWSAVDVTKARSIVQRDPSTIQAYGIYELGKDRNQRQVRAFKERFTEIANENGWTPSEANDVWAGIKFNHHQVRKEEKHSSIAGEKGALRFNMGGADGSLNYGDVNQDTLSEELADSVRNFDFANFRPGTAEAALEGWQRATTGDLAGTPEATAIVNNYKEIANTLQIRMRSGQPIFTDGDETPGGGYPGDVSTGGSARADAGWRRFVETVSPGQTPGPRQIPGQGQLPGVS